MLEFIAAVVFTTCGAFAVLAMLVMFVVLVAFVVFVVFVVMPMNLWA
ncbi:hypothetical protein [Streptomyces sp. NPDC017991]